MSAADAAGAPLCPLGYGALGVLLAEERGLAWEGSFPPPTRPAGAARVLPATRLPAYME